MLLPTAMNAVALLPEVLFPLPKVNDDAEHVVMAERANQAISMGENPLDMWVPQLELGFPQFLYYQHLPHLTVVAVDRVLLGALPLRTVFDLTRYLLLLAFPLTVFWSMRTMGFSLSAAAMGAAASSLISGNFRYGFEYDSYVWRGSGLFTQLFGMHLSFVALAAIHRVVTRGRGVVSAALASSALVLAHVIYAYMLAIAAIVLFLFGLRRANVRGRVGRLALVGALVGLLASYFVVPFFTQAGYLNASTYLERFKYDSFGVGPILGWLVTGDLFDHGRLPVLTALLAIGLAVAVARREQLALLVAAIGGVFVLFYFGRPTWGALVDLLPMHEGLLLHRFIGGVDLAAVPLMGFGGGWLFDVISARVPRRGLVLATAALVVLLAPALGERWAFYAEQTTWMRQTDAALAADADARAVLDAIPTQPGGRVYAGLASNWGARLDFGIPFRSVRFYNLLAARGLDAVAPPYRGASLNSDLLFSFNDQDLAQYQLYNIAYVIAPHDVKLPSALRVVLDTPRYVLYAAPGGTYAEYVGIARRERPASQADLFARELAFVRSGDVASRAFARFDYRDAGSQATDSVPVPRCPRDGEITYQRVQAARFDLAVRCDTASAMVLKVTYHPNWHVAIDGEPVPTYMASPSYVGFDVPPGQHFISAEYLSSPLKTPLVALGLLTLLGMVAVSFRSRVPRLTATYVPAVHALRRLARWGRSGPAAAVAISALALVVFWALAPSIGFNDGLGNDGRIYAKMVQALREHFDPQVVPPWSYRILPVALVAALPMSARVGFLALDVAAVLGSALLLYLLLRRYGTVANVALLAVFWWTVLPFGPRYALYYPVLPDTLGFFLLLVLLLSAMERRFALFATTLIVAALTRENLLALVPFLWLANVRQLGVVRATALTFVASLPGVVAFEVARLFPVFPPPAGFENWLDRYRFDVNIRFVIENVDGSLWRYLLAAPITLGLFFAIPVAALRRTALFLWREPAWAYYIALMLALSLLGGRDDGRYAYLLLPALGVLTFVATGPTFWTSNVVRVVLTAIHVGVALFLRPSGSTEADYLQYTVAFMTLDHLRETALVAAVGFAATLIIVRRDRLSGISAAIARRAGRRAG